MTSISSSASKSPLQIGANPQAPLPPSTTSWLGNEVTIEDTDKLTIAGKTFNSRLMTGTGKYPAMNVMQESVAVSGCEIVTVAVRSCLLYTSDAATILLV